MCSLLSCSVLWCCVCVDVLCDDSLRAVVVFWCCVSRCALVVLVVMRFALLCFDVMGVVLFCL